MTPKEERNDGRVEGFAPLDWTFEPFHLGIGLSLSLAAIALWETISLRDIARAQIH